MFGTIFSYLPLRFILQRILLFTFQCTFLFLVFSLERFVLYYTFFSLSTLFRHFFKKLFLLIFEQNKKLVISAFFSFLFIFFITNSSVFLLSFAVCLVLFYNSIFVSFCQHFFWFFYLFLCYYFLFFLHFLSAHLY